MTRKHDRIEKQRIREEKNLRAQELITTRRRNKRIINYSIITVVVICIGYFIVNLATTDKKPAPYDAFAQCITSKGAIMYGTNWCPHCQAQKKQFGNSFKYINFIDCDTNKVICDLAGAKGYPTWIFSDGTKLSGELTLERLAELTACKIQDNEIFEDNTTVV